MPISGRVNKASAPKAVNPGSIADWIKLKAIKIGIYRFLALRLELNDTGCGRQAAA